MSSPAIILTSEFVTTHDEGSVNYLDRRDRQIDKEKVISSEIESEAKEILSLDVLKSLNESDFANYLNYMGRQQALSKKETLNQTELLELTKIEGSLKEIKGSMSQPKPTTPNHLKVRGLFDKENDHLNGKQKEFYRDFYSQASKNGALLFQDVVSFDTSFLIKQGLFDPTTGELDSKKLKDAGRVMMSKYFELENFDKTGQWVGAIHYNTDNFHIHFSTTENMNTRQMITITDRKTGQEKIVPNGYKKESTIREMKSVFVNQLIDRNQELNQINNLRNQLVTSMRTENHEQLIGKQLSELVKKLPDEKNKWQYNRLPKETKQLINECVQTILSKKKDYPSFQSLIKEEDEFRKQLYHTKADNDYYKNKLKEMDTRLGNALLKNMINDNQLVSKPFILENKPTDEKNKNPKTNLDHYSKSNQKLILNQFPDATKVQSKWAWLKENRTINSDAIPIQISIPIIDDDGKTLLGFGTGDIYDQSQTTKRDLSGYSFEQVKQSPARHNDLSGPANIYRYSKKNQEAILKRFSKSQRILSEKQWLDAGYKVNKNEKPVLLEFTFKGAEKNSKIKVEIPFFDKSQVQQATSSELYSFQREYDQIKNEPYKADKVSVASRTVKKISNLLEKDYDNERRKFEKERLDRQVSFAQQQNDFSY